MFNYPEFPWAWCLHYILLSISPNYSFFIIDLLYLVVQLYSSAVLCGVKPECTHDFGKWLRDLKIHHRV